MHTNVKNLKASNDSSQLSLDASTKSIWNFIKPIKAVKKKRKDKRHKTLKASMRRQKDLEKSRKIGQIRRIFGPKYPVNSESKITELDEILMKSPKNPIKFQVFYRRDSSINEMSPKLAGQSPRNRNCEISFLDQFLETKLKSIQVNNQRKASLPSRTPTVNTPNGVKEVFESARAINCKRFSKIGTFGEACRQRAQDNSLLDNTTGSL